VARQPAPVRPEEPPPSPGPDFPPVQEPPPEAPDVDPINPVQEPPDPARRPDVL
jgi:hypothetical protein